MSTSPVNAEPLSTATLESLERARRQMLLMVVITSLLWMVPQILQSLFDAQLPVVLRSILILAGLAGALVWMVTMWRFHGFQQRVQASPGLRDRLDDERVRELRLAAIYRGWAVLVVLLGMGVALAPFATLPDLPVLLTLLLVAVNAPIVSFLILDRD